MSERILYYSGEDPNKASRIANMVLAHTQRENRELKALLRTAQERLLDMLKMDDGQAFSEATKFVKRLDVYFEDKKKLDVV
jgi:L-2-hydroxyglutarate oxidase LhgO